MTLLTSTPIERIAADAPEGSVIIHYTNNDTGILAWVRTPEEFADYLVLTDGTIDPVVFSA